MTDGSTAPIRRLDLAMAVAALVALAALIGEHGLLIQDPWRQLLYLVQAACGLVFGGLQAAKLLVVERPREYLRSRWLDFSLLFVLWFQIAALVAIVATPEQRYLDARELPSPISAFYVAALQIYLLLIVGLRSPLIHRALLHLHLRPVQALVVSFLLLIVAGTLLLALPGSNAGGHALPLVDALFTATSAVCVTGLVVRDTGVHFTPLGHTVLLGLMQAGGLGMLTITGFFSLFGRGVSAAEGRVLAQAMEVESEAGMLRAIGRIVAVTLALEATGAALLFGLWRDLLPDPLTRAAWAAFHAVSAFCNAGFALFEGNASLTSFAASPPTLAVMGGLIVLGGLGFGVLWEALTGALWRRGARDGALRRHARWVLATTAALLVAGTVAFWILERHGILRTLGGPTSWVNAAFQSVTLRTAGFNTLDLAALGLPGVVLCIALMLVGGSPASTAGGMKTTTAAVALAGALRLGRLPGPLVRRALALGAIYLGAWLLFVFLLGLAQGGLDRRVAFEAASALGTVGLSLGLTGELTEPAKLVLAVAMFAGRVGPFALVASLVALRDSAAPEPPKQRILLG